MSIPYKVNCVGNEPWATWDFERWKYEVQHANENITTLKGRGTPSVIANVTNLNYFFTDAATPVNYYKGDTLPNWEYTNVTNCDNFNRSNKSTIIGYFNAPNCTSAQNAFFDCTKLKEIFPKTFNIGKIGNFLHNCRVMEGGTYIFNDITDNIADSACKLIGVDNQYDKNKKPLDKIIFRFKKNYPYFNRSALNYTFGGTYVKEIEIYNLVGSSFNFPFLNCTAVKIYIHFAPRTTTKISGGGGKIFQNAVNLKTLIMDGEVADNIDDINCLNLLKNCKKLQFVYFKDRFKAGSFKQGAYDALKLTQIPLDFSATSVMEDAFFNCKLDLETVQNLADENIGVKNISDTLPITIGVSLYKLAKDTSAETLEKYPLYTTGVTKFDENDNLLYVKNGGGETTSQSEAVLNSYVLTDTSIIGKTDISTVTDVSSFTDDDWENYYGYPPASGTMYYATGPLLKAFRTISDRGWNITVQYN